LLIDNFIKTPQLNRKYPVEQQKKEKGSKNYKQGYIHASYQAAEMAFLSIMSTNFF